MPSVGATAGPGPGRWRILWALLLACAVSIQGPLGDALLWSHKALRIELWAVDRAAHLMYGVDADGFVVRSAVVGREGGFPPEPRERRLPGDWRLASPIDAQGDRSVAFAPDRPEWGRARPGCWILVRPEGDALRGASFLERWVRTGAPVKWRRAFRFVLPWRSRAIASRETGVWVAAEGSCSLRFYRHTGHCLLECDLKDGTGVEALCSASPEAGGGVWIAAGGALMRLDREGARLPGQGGFAHLVELIPGAP